MILCCCGVVLLCCGCDGLLWCCLCVFVLLRFCVGVAAVAASLLVFL